MKKLLLLLVPFAFAFCSNDASSAKEKAVTETVENTPAPAAANQAAETNAATDRTPLTLTAGGATVRSGSDVCLDIAAADFNRLISMQYTLQWDPQVLEFTKVQGFALPYLGPQNYGTHRTAEGLLTFVWIDNSLKGIDLPDGSAVYQLCFTAKGQSGQASSIGFIETPTPFEVVNAKEEVLPLNGVEGVVEIE